MLKVPLGPAEKADPDAEPPEVTDAVPKEAVSLTLLLMDKITLPEADAVFEEALAVTTPVPETPLTDPDPLAVNEPVADLLPDGLIVPVEGFG
jgi:hypothetical protein